MFDYLKNKENRHKVIVIIGIIYGFVWSLIKVIIGIFTYDYLYLISGIYTLFIAINRNLYLNLYFKAKKNINIYFMAIFLVIIGIAYTIYAARLFFIPNKNINYSLKLAIAIAFISFVELGYAIYTFLAVKNKKDIIPLAYRTMGLATGLFALVNTQSAIMMANGTQSNFADGLFGVIAGVITIILGFYLMIQIKKYQVKNKLS